jgi:hypothetical protein
LVDIAIRYCLLLCSFARPVGSVDAGYHSMYYDYGVGRGNLHYSLILGVFEPDAPHLFFGLIDCCAGF